MRSQDLLDNHRLEVGDLVIDEQDGVIWIIIDSSACIGTDIRMHEIFDGYTHRLCTGKLLRVVNKIVDENTR